MSKNKIEVLERDDEILREQGMTSGTAKCGRWKLRTTSATEVSWMQRNLVLEDSGMDILWKTCAFAFIHAEDRAVVRESVNDRELFTEAVDAWMDEHKPTSSDIKTLASAMNSRIEEWFSSSSDLAQSGQSSGN